MCGSETMADHDHVDISHADKTVSSNLLPPSGIEGTQQPQCKTINVTKYCILNGRWLGECSTNGRDDKCIELSEDMSTVMWSGIKEIQCEDV
jgi:hypothetical protein